MARTWLKHGAVVIPAALRDAYGLKEGAELEVTDSGGEISLKPVLDSRRDAPSRRSLTSEEVLSIVRSFPKYEGPVVTDEMMHEAISRAAIEDWARLERQGHGQADD